VAFKYTSPIVGEKFGDREVMSTKYKRNKRGDTLWNVKCKCGEMSWQKACRLTKGRAQMCRSCHHENISNHGKYTPWFLFREASERAKKKNIEFKLSLDYLDSILEDQEFKCIYSGVELGMEFSINKRVGKNTASIDRIDSSKGYIEGNVQWVHKVVNNMKSSLAEGEFLKWCKLVAKNN